MPKVSNKLKRHNYDDYATDIMQNQHIVSVTHILTQTNLFQQEGVPGATVHYRDIKLRVGYVVTNQRCYGYKCEAQPMRRDDGKVLKYCSQCWKAHVIQRNASQLNGNNGSATNTDDHSDTNAYYKKAIPKAHSCFYVHGVCTRPGQHQTNCNAVSCANNSRTCPRPECVKYLLLVEGDDMMWNPADPTQSLGTIKTRQQRENDQLNGNNGSATNVDDHAQKVQCPHDAWQMCCCYECVCGTCDRIVMSTQKEKVVEQPCQYRNCTNFHIDANRFDSAKCKAMELKMVNNGARPVTIQKYNKCVFCSDEKPDHPGSACPKKKQKDINFNIAFNEIDHSEKCCCVFKDICRERRAVTYDYPTYVRKYNHTAKEPNDIQAYLWPILLFLWWCACNELQPTYPGDYIRISDCASVACGSPMIFSALPIDYSSCYWISFTDHPPVCFCSNITSNYKFEHVGGSVICMRNYGPGCAFPGSISFCFNIGAYPGVCTNISNQTAAYGCQDAWVSAFRIGDVTVSPTRAPTDAPTATKAPVAPPTNTPTDTPITPKPTPGPTKAPVAPTGAPTFVGQPTPQPTTCTSPIDVNLVGVRRQDSPLWVTFDDPNENSIDFADCRAAAVRTRKQRNKEQHALNGNTEVAVEYKSKSRFQAFADKQYRLPEGAKVQEHPVNTPNAAKDFIASMLDERIKRQGFMVFEAKLICWFVDPQNIDCELDKYDHDKEEKESILHNRQSNAMNQRPVSGNGMRTSKSAEEKKKQAQIREDDAITKANNYNAGLQRCVQKLKTKPQTIHDWWHTHAECKDYRLSVLEHLWGAGWQDMKEMTSAQWAMYCIINHVSRELATIQLLELLPEWRSTVVTHDMTTTWHHTMGRVWSEDITVLEAERAQHNKAVHALNGNIMSRKQRNKLQHALNGNTEKSALCHVFSDVEAQSPMSAYYDNTPFSTTIPISKGSELALKLNTLPSSTNPTQLSVPSATVFRADVIGSDNIILPDRYTYMPITALIPRTIRGGEALPLQPVVNNRLPLRTLGPVPYEICSLTSTGLNAIIEQAALRANQNLGRADNTSLGGWNAIDLAVLSRMNAFYGLSMDQCVAKLLLLHEITSWATDGNDSLYQPIIQTQIIDQFTTPDFGDITVAMNDSPVFGEDCGGPTSVLPLDDGDTGEIFFHLTLETVPLTRRSLAVWLPATLQMQDTQSSPGLATAIFCAMWAPAPFGIWTVKAHTTDSLGGNPEIQTYVSAHSLIHIPGQTTLDIILTRKTTARNPTQQAEANLLAVIQPTTGSKATTAYPVPGTPLNIAFVGGVPVGHNMAQYFNSWSNDFKPTEIANFLQRLSYLTGIGPALLRVDDIITHNAFLFPFMITDRAADPFVFWPPDSVQQFACSDVRCTTFEPTSENFPQGLVPRPSYLINQTDQLAWNKVAVGLCTNSEAVELDWRLPDKIGNVQDAFWSQMQAMVYAAFWNSHYCNIGWGGEIWDTAYTNTTMPEFRQQAQGYYAIVARDRRKPANTAFGPMLADYFCAITKRRPASNTNEGNKVTVFDYICPPTGSYKVIFNDSGEVRGNIIPVNITDIWMQLMTKCLPKWQSSFPVPNGPDSLKGFWKGLVNAFVGAGFIGGLVDQAFYRLCIDGNETVDFSDETRWNERVMYNTTPAIPLFLNGTAVAESILTLQSVKLRGILNSQFTSPSQANGLPASNTMAIPTVNFQGKIIFAGGLPTQVQQTRLALYQKTQLAVSTWQFGMQVAWNDDLTQGDTSSKSKFSKYRKRADKAEQKTEDKPGKVSSPSTVPVVEGEILMSI